MMIENEMKKKGLTLTTFASCEGKISEQRVLSNPEGDYRPLKLWERQGAMKTIHYATLVFGATYLSLAIWMLLDVLPTF